MAVIKMQRTPLGRVDLLLYFTVQKDALKCF